MSIPKNHAQKLVGLILVPGDLMSGRLRSKPFRQRLITSRRLLIRLRFAIIAALVLSVVSMSEIIGGWSIAVTTPTTPPSDTFVWSITGHLNVARQFHAATLLRDGKVLINGGFGAGDSSIAELYDPATGIWTNTGSSN